MDNMVSDNLIQSVLEFMFIPESILSIVFLVIFFFCFVYGVVKVRKCKAFLDDYNEHVAEYYEKEKQHLNQWQFLNRLKGELAAREVKIIDLPNVFVSIGILGTFLGLGVAIHGAADLLHAETVDINKLNSVLSVIAFKFQMSVWGTCFSLLFQRFIAEPYFEKKQLIFGQIAGVIYSDAVSYSTAMEWQLAELQGIRAGQTEAKITFTGELKDIQNRQNAFLDGLTEHGRMQKDIADKQEVSNSSRMTQFNNLVDKLITHQSEVKDQMINQQKNLLDEEKDFSKKNADLLKSDFAEKLEEQKNFLTGLIGEQKDYVNGLIERQSALSGEQQNYIKDLVDKQSEMNGQLAEQHKILLGDAKASTLDSAKMVVDGVAGQLEQQRQYMEKLMADQNEMSTRLAEQERALLGDVREFNKNNSESVLANFAAQLEQQRQHMEKLLAEQNEISKKLALQQKTLMDNADASQRERADSIVDNIEQQLVKQRAFIEKLIAQQSQLNEILLGDMQKSSETNSNYMREGILQQIEKFKNFAEELAKEQKLTQKLLEDKLDELNKNIANNSEMNTSGLVEQQKFIRDLFEKQSDLSEALIEDIQRVSGEGAENLAKIIAEHIAEYKGYSDKLNASINDFNKMNSDNIAGQKDYIEKLFAQQSQLSKALLGDMQKTGEANSNRMRDGMLQQMEQYKRHAEELSKEQKNIQKALEALNAHVDKTSAHNDTNIEELRKAMDLLQKTLEKNSKALNDIITDFYSKQSDLDDLRRTEIMGIAESFNTLLHQEGKNTASWRKANGEVVNKAEKKNDNGKK